jgi:hypothetical protein
LEHQTGDDREGRPVRGAMKRARKSIFAGIEKTTCDEIRNRIIYGTIEWPLVAAPTV